jgi:hypothetical protein
MPCDVSEKPITSALKPSFSLSLPLSSSDPVRLKIAACRPGSRVSVCRGTGGDPGPGEGPNLVRRHRNGRRNRRPTTGSGGQQNQQPGCHEAPAGQQRRLRMFVSPAPERQCAGGLAATADRRLRPSSRGIGYPPSAPTPADGSSTTARRFLRHQPRVTNLNARADPRLPATWPGQLPPRRWRCGPLPSSRKQDVHVLDLVPEQAIVEDQAHAEILRPLELGEVGRPF